MPDRSVSERWVMWVLGGILLARLILGTVYSLVVPAWESHDEWGHYAFVHYLATERSLPSTELSTEIAHDETAQPPLYYILAAAATAWIHTGEFLQPAQNLYVANPEGTGGVNFALHTDDEGWPFRGNLLAMHVARLVSVLLSVASVWLTFLCARIVFRRAAVPTLVATAIVAFWPEYIFVGSVVSNDGMAVTGGLLVLLFALRVATVWPPKLLDLVGLGAALGIAVLSKYSTLGLLALVPVVAVFLVVRAIRRRSLPRSLLPAALAGVAALGVGAWWYARNLAQGGSLTLRYQGMLTALKTLVSDPASWLARMHPVDWGDKLEYGFLTFTGSFGWGNVGAPSAYYTAFRVLLALGLLGCLVWCVRRRPGVAGLGMLAAYAVSFPVPHVYLLYYSSRTILRGRTLLPLLPVLAIVLAVGLTRWFDRRALRWMLVAIPVGLLACSAWVPAGIIAPAYAGAAVVQENDFAGAQHPADLLFGDDLRLLGYDYGPATASDDPSVRITLYWTAVSRPQTDYAVRISLLSGDATVGGFDTYPGRGTAPTSSWTPGTVLVDSMMVPIRSDASTEDLAAVISVIRPGDSQPLSAVDGDGRFVGTRVTLARVTAAP